MWGEVMLKFVKNGSVLLLMSVLLLLAACSSNSASPSADASSSQPAQQVELTISAAASLTDALQALQPTFEADHPGLKLVFNFGASGTLQQQIEQGAPADLFLSAANKNMQALVDKGLIDEAHRANLLTNTLVAVVPKDGAIAMSSFADLSQSGIQHIAVGIPESVPAGAYAKEALENAKLWDALQAKIVQAKDVRQVLQYVETGNADVGFVYKTDAFSSDKTAIAFEVDPATHTPIEYPMGIVKESKHPEEAAALFAYLQSKAALDVFANYGFSTPAAAS